MITKITRHNAVHIDSSSLSKLKAQAKELKRSENITHTEALEIIAQKFGFDNWHQVVEGNKLFHVTERYFKDGIFAVFDIKDAVDIFDTKFILTEDELAESVVRNAYYQHYIHLNDEEDIEERQLKDIYSEDELKELFDDEITSKRFYRINVMIPELNESDACYTLNSLLEKTTFKLPLIYIVKGRFVENDFTFELGWSEEDDTYRPEHWPENQKNIVSDICIDPNLPTDFDSKDNSLRSKLEIEHWWNRPFIRTGMFEGGYVYMLRALDGGAWDRTTGHGVFDELEKAIDAAKALKESN